MNKIRELTLKEVTSSIPDLRQCASLEILRLNPLDLKWDWGFMDDTATGRIPQLPISIRIVDLFNCQKLSGNVPDMSENINLERMKLKCCYALTGMKGTIASNASRVHGVLRVEGRVFMFIT